MPPQPKNSLGSKLKAAGIKTPPKVPREPLWDGPQKDGVTFSMLTRFLSCRERFRVAVIEGLKPSPQFSHRIEYGQMWHTCEEALAKNPIGWPEGWNGKGVWEQPLQAYAMNLCKKYPTSQEPINHWWSICKTQFPIYVNYWARNQDVIDRTPLFQEQVFNVPYKLPSGRTVKLRGKWDGVDIIGKGKSAGLYLFETKTKGDVDPLALQRQLTGDLQTMIYLTSLTLTEGLPEVPLKGIRYNVIKRPLSGGAGSIRQHKPTKSNPRGESTDEFYERLGGIIQEKPDEFFYRWKIDIAPSDIERFKQRTLTPILEQLCDWYDWVATAHRCQVSPYSDIDVTSQGRHKSNTLHWQHPFGSVNTIDEYGASDVDEYLATGSTVGLYRAEKLFTELV